MSVTVNVSYNISIEGASPWKAHAKFVRMVDDEPFIKLAGSDSGLANIVIGNKKNRKCSISNSHGLQKLKIARGRHQEQTFADAADNSVAAMFAASQATAGSPGSV